MSIYVSYICLFALCAMWTKQRLTSRYLPPKVNTFIESNHKISQFPIRHANSERKPWSIQSLDLGREFWALHNFHWRKTTATLRHLTNHTCGKRRKPFYHDHGTVFVGVDHFSAETSHFGEVTSNSSWKNALQIYQTPRNMSGSPSMKSWWHFQIWFNNWIFQWFVGRCWK